VWKLKTTPDFKIKKIMEDGLSLRYPVDKGWNSYHSTKWKNVELK
jgi:hypothetical protein